MSNEDSFMGEAPPMVNVINATPHVRIKEPDVFEGQRSVIAVRSWLNSLELYFKLTHMEDDQTKLYYALSLLCEGDAQLWFSQLPSVNEGVINFANFGAFKTALSREFIPVNAVFSARDDLWNLVQTGSVSDYINNFRRIRLQIPDEVF